MTKRTTSSGWGDRLGQLGTLFRNTVSVMGHRSIITGPVLRMSLYAVVMTTLFFLFPVLVLYEKGGASMWVLLLALLMFFYKFFFYSKVELVLSRLAYESVTGGSLDVAEARKKVSGRRSDVLILGLLSMAGAWIRRSGKSEKQSLVGKIMLGAMAGIQDLASLFLLPAFAVDRLTLRNAASRIKELKNHVPETLAGVFGVDVLGRVVMSLMTPFYVWLVVAGFVLGLLLGARMPEAFEFGTLGAAFPAMPDTWPLIGPDTIFSWFPLFVVLFCGFLVNALFGRLVATIKVVYFTLFYTRIGHRDDLSDEARETLDDYLAMDPVD